MKISKKATTIAIVNQKGGTGKTTTCENLGVGLAAEGKKVLMVDTNKQYLVINGYPVVFSFSNEPNPEAFERIRDILLATSYTKKAG